MLVYTSTDGSEVASALVQGGGTRQLVPQEVGIPAGVTTRVATKTTTEDFNNPVDDAAVADLSVTFPSWTSGDVMRVQAAIPVDAGGGDTPILFATFFLKVTNGSDTYIVTSDGSEGQAWEAFVNEVPSCTITVPVLTLFPVELDGAVTVDVWIVGQASGGGQGAVCTVERCTLSVDVLAASAVDGTLSSLLAEGP